MTKYTIYKAFEKQFSLQIWKIVVDGPARLIAVELRDTETTLPHIYVFDFAGQLLLKHTTILEKEWTLEAIQQQTLILKRVGDTVPIKEGIWLIGVDGKTRYKSYEYTWVDTCMDYVKVRHRSFQSGFEEYIDIRAAQKIVIQGSMCDSYRSSVKMPIPYTGHRPPYLHHIAKTDLVWLSRIDEKLLWTYHGEHNGLFHLNLCIADESNMLYETRLLDKMPKMIPQPYFQIGNQIFLMSYNKQEIVSYLV